MRGVSEGCTVPVSVGPADLQRPIVGNGDDVIAESEGWITRGCVTSDGNSSEIGDGSGED